MNTTHSSLRSFILDNQDFPNYIPNRNDLLHTETFDRIMQSGGKNKDSENLIKGIRYENNLSEVNSSSLSSISEMYGGRKNKPSISDKLHQDAIDYLKNDLKLSPLEARAYKSLAYRYIKEKHADSTSAERSKLMISLIKSENFLDEFKDKLDETMKIIENIDSEKNKTNSSNNSVISDITETSEEKVKKPRKSKKKD
jgi:hypothetical protein